MPLYTPITVIHGTAEMRLILEHGLTLLYTSPCLSVQCHCQCSSFCTGPTGTLWDSAHIAQLLLLKHGVGNKVCCEESSTFAQMVTQMLWVSGTFTTWVVTLVYTVGPTLDHCDICLPHIPGSCTTWSSSPMETHIVTPTKLHQVLSRACTSSVSGELHRFFQKTG